MEGEISDEISIGERWDPLGAPNNNEESTCESGIPKRYECCERSLCIHESQTYEEKLKNLEEEQELLNSSLCALTSHFAQLQFRLRQAVAAPYPDKENLLKSLEEFAFRGVPEIGTKKEMLDEPSVVEIIWLRRVQQQQLIDELKGQIQTFENMLCTKEEIGYDLLKNQKLIYDDLSAIGLEYNRQKYYIQRQINSVLNQLGSPLRIKEQFIEQLKIQVADLERFIQYLQNNEIPKKSICKCGGTLGNRSLKVEPTKCNIHIIKRLIRFLQMLSVVYLGYRPGYNKKSHLHNWDDLRAKLEIAITNVIDAVKFSETEKIPEENYASENEELDIPCNVKITTAVRKDLVVCIKDLIQHGACNDFPMYKLVPFIKCFKQPTFKSSDTQIHAWEIILKYYHLKNGEQFNSTAATRLSSSFNLDITGSSGTPNRQNILYTIGNIIAGYSVSKLNHDCHFKAFICAALNANQLVAWLEMIFQCRNLLEMHYYTWSYARSTGFADSLNSMQKLTNIKFNLPTDLSIYRLADSNDAFM